MIDENGRGRTGYVPEGDSRGNMKSVMISLLPAALH